MSLSDASNYGLGVLGIVVGLVTYFLSERKNRRNRWQSAKDVILRDLAMALGEGTIPPPEVITATIRSTLRSQNVSNLEAVTLGEIADDLIRQITSDPFLTGPKRTELQGKVLEMVQSGTKAAETGRLDRTVAVEPSSFPLSSSSLASLLSALLASIAVVSLGLIFNSVADENNTVAFDSEFAFRLLVPMMAVLLAVIVLSMITTALTREIRARREMESDAGLDSSSGITAVKSTKRKDEDNSGS